MELLPASKSAVPAKEALGGSRDAGHAEPLATGEKIPSRAEIEAVLSSARDLGPDAGDRNAPLDETRIQKIWAEGAALTMGNKVPRFTVGGHAGVSTSDNPAGEGCNIDMGSTDPGPLIDDDYLFLRQRPFLGPIRRLVADREAERLQATRRKTPNFDAAYARLLAAHEGAHCVQENRGKPEPEAHADALAAYTSLARSYRAGDPTEVAAARAVLTQRLARLKRMLKDEPDLLESLVSAVRGMKWRLSSVNTSHGIGYYPVRWALEEPPTKFVEATEAQVRARAEEIYAYLEANRGTAHAGVNTALKPPPWSLEPARR